MQSAPWGPADARRGAWAAAGAGLFAVSMLGRAEAASAGHLIVAGLTYAAAMTVALAAIARHHRHPRFGPANLVTTFRVALAAMVVGAAWDAPRVELAWWSVALTLSASALDGVDGWLARRSRLESPFGARFDMEVDALLTLALSLLVWRFGKAGAWVLACGLLRYLFVAARLVWPWLGGRLTPTRRGQTVAVLQFVGLAAALAPPVPRSWSTALAAATLAALCWSFALDILRLWRARGAMAERAAGPTGGERAGYTDDSR
jgi:phosphatidylglycerophosphate synthase